MAENSKIQWTNHTFNPWRGCTKVAPGCANCYADAMSKRNPKTLGVWGDKGTRVVASESMWREPLKWDRLAKEAGERHRVFCASLADVFEDWRGAMFDAGGNQLFRDGDGWFAPGSGYMAMSGEITMDDVRRRLFALIDATPNLDWQLVTKRPENVRRMWPIEATGEKQSPFPGLMPPMAVHTRKFRPNVWLLTSVSDQATADAMIPHLLGCRDLVPVLGLSAEPLLGPVDLDNYFGFFQCNKCLGICNVWDGRSRCCDGEAVRFIDWVIVGGESGHGRRKMKAEWAQGIIDQCRDAGMASFMKQMEIDGQVTGDIERFPVSLQFREYPNTKASV